MRKLCEWKGVSIVEAECCPDHIHMLLEIPPKMDTVGKNKAKVAEYIRHQRAEDKLGEQLSIPYTGSPFTGRR